MLAKRAVNWLVAWLRLGTYDECTILPIPDPLQFPIEVANTGENCSLAWSSSFGFVQWDVDLGCIAIHRWCHIPELKQVHSFDSKQFGVFGYKTTALFLLVQQLDTHVDLAWQSQCVVVDVQEGYGNRLEWRWANSESNIFAKCLICPKIQMKFNLNIVDWHFNFRLIWQIKPMFWIFTT